MPVATSSMPFGWRANPNSHCALGQFCRVLGVLGYSLGEVSRVPQKSLVSSLLSVGLVLLLGLAHSPQVTAQTPISTLSLLTPVEVVMGFYAALQARDFTDAYTFLSPAAQAERPFASWAGGYLTTQRVDVQTSPGATPDTVSVELWVSDGTLPRVHGYAGTWSLVQDATNQAWHLDQAAISEEPPPSFPFAPRPTAHCTPPNPDPPMAIACRYQLNGSLPAGATVTVTSVTPQPLGAPVNLDCASVTGGLTCLSSGGPLRPFSAELRCSPPEPSEECPADASFTAKPLSLNGGHFSQAVTIAPLEDGTTLTFFVEPDPPVTFTTLVPSPPPAPSARVPTVGGTNFALGHLMSLCGSFASEHL